ncbi:hypothetical protein BHE74_00051216 [Ensete ventricosum]|nr:hypothetical protein BHE74_00051216 [Ensete ventricosum]
MHRVDAVRNSPGVRRELTEGIESLLEWCKGVRQKKTETHRKIIGGSRKAGWDSQGTRREITRRRPEDYRKNAIECQVSGTHRQHLGSRDPH